MNGYALFAIVTIVALALFVYTAISGKLQYAKLMVPDHKPDNDTYNVTNE
jgi:hypothetical protein